MSLAIDLYTEINCPWSIIGMHRLDKVLAERFPTLPVDIRHHPVILWDDCPPEGLRIADRLASRYGITDPAQAWDRPEREARASGLDLVLSRQPFAYPTLPAHTLIRLAGPRGTQHALAVAITHAYFHEARNIGDAEVLADIATSHNFDRDEARRLVTDPAELKATRAEVALSSISGVTTVPHFVFGNVFTLIGGRSEDEFAGAVEKAAASVRETQNVG